MQLLWVDSKNATRTGSRLQRPQRWRPRQFRQRLCGGRVEDISLASATHPPFLTEALCGGAQESRGSGSDRSYRCRQDAADSEGCRTRPHARYHNAPGPACSATAEADVPDSEMSYYCVFFAMGGCNLGSRPPNRDDCPYCFAAELGHPLRTAVRAGARSPCMGTIVPAARVEVD